MFKDCVAANGAVRFSACGFGCAPFYFPEKRVLKEIMKERIRE